MIVGLPVLNRPDMAARMISSIDRLCQLVVIINGDPVIQGPIKTAAHNNPMVQNAIWIVPPTNLGVAASWNLIIRSFPADWWMLVNADITFSPGDLELVQPNGAGVWCLYEFGAFALTGETIDRVGWFDENFHPIYFEDNDYRYRCHLAGVPVVDLPGQTRHDNSSTINSGYRRDNDRTFPENGAYYQAKWGGWPGHETLETPFGLAVGPDWWRLDRNRLADQAWT